MKKNNNIIFIVVAIVLIISIATLLYLNKANISENIQNNKDIELFNSLNSENLDKSICEKIENNQIKNNCNDNYHSIKAFNELNEDECKNIKSEKLSKLCIQEVLKFKK